MFDRTSAKRARSGQDYAPKSRRGCGLLETGSQTFDVPLLDIAGNRGPAWNRVTRLRDASTVKATAVTVHRNNTHNRRLLFNIGNRSRLDPFFLRTRLKHFQFFLVLTPAFKVLLFNCILIVYIDHNPQLSSNTGHCKFEIVLESSCRVRAASNNSTNLE